MNTFYILLGVIGIIGIAAGMICTSIYSDRGNGKATRIWAAVILVSIVLFGIALFRVAKDQELETGQTQAAAEYDTCPYCGHDLP